MSLTRLCDDADLNDDTPVSGAIDPDFSPTKSERRRAKVCDNGLMASVN